MSDLATLGLRIHSDEVDLAEKRLNDLERTASRTERATDGLSGGFGRAGTATGQMDERLIQAARSQDDVIRHTKSLGSALGNLAGDAAMGGASLDSMATNGGRAAVSLLELGARAVALTGVVGILVVTAGLMAAAWLDAEKSSLALERAATGLGRTAGLTGEELGNLATAAAEQGGVSIRSAKEQAAAYISTGKIGGEMISLLIADGKDLASFLGKDLPDAASYLATSMGDPSKAAVEMTRQFGLLTQEQIKQIEKAQEAGDAARAQKILMDALSGAAEGHAQNVDLMTSAWDRIGRSISNATHNFGEWLLVTDTEKLAKYDATIANSQRTGGNPRIIARMEQERQDLAFAIGYRNAARENTERSSAANQAAQARADAARTTRTTRASGGSGGASRTDRDQANLIRQSQQLIEQMNREAEVYGLTWEQLARYNAEKQIAAMATNGWTQQEMVLAASIRGATDAMVARRKLMDGEVMDAMPRLDLKPLDVPVIRLVDQLRLVGDELQRIDEMTVRAAYGLSEAFGRPGRAAGDLLAITSAYAIERNRLDQMERDGMNVERERAYAQIANYGDMASAAKGFFAEGSDGYKILQAAEQGYRLFQFAMSIQAMAMGATETAASVGQSATRGAASMAAGAAKMFEFLGPLGFPAVVAMVAVLAALGLKGRGGSKGGGGYSASNDNVDASVSTAQGYVAADERARESAAQSVASKVEVRVTADRDGLNAYVARTAQQEAVGIAAPMVAAAAAGTKRDVFQTLNERQVGNRKISV